MSNKYSAQDIQVLEGLEPVRKRPGMYIGSTDISGLHHLTTEIVNNSVDEALAGACDFIEVNINKDNSVTVIDNGRGIPVDIKPEYKVSALELVMTKLHAGGKFAGTGYKVAGGLHGVGASVVNALSTHAEVIVKLDNKFYSQTYEKGVPTSKLVEIKGDKDFDRLGFESGTKITFLPDKDIFDTIVSDFPTLRKTYREYAYLTKGLTFSLLDSRNGARAKFYFEGGILSYVNRQNRHQEVIHSPIFYTRKEINDIDVEIALQYCNSYSEKVFLFANNINTIHGGSHESGFRAALTRTLNQYARKENILKEKDANLSGDDVREGLTAVVSVKLASATLQFEGQTKTKLGNAEVKPVVESVMKEGFTEYLQENPGEAQKIFNKCLLAAQARLAARKARDTVIRKGALEGSNLPGLLADCQEKNPEYSELFIVEGISAGGSAKQARDRKSQAVLPLGGKVLNTERHRLDKILNHEELRNLIIALGVGIGENKDMEKLRYHKIILMMDADVDGGHILTLLLTFFYRHMHEIIDGGYLYIAQPPLYKITLGKESRYILREEDKDAMLKGNADKAIVQRFKGLGEMNAEQLRETTMSVASRHLKQVAVEDAEKAEETFVMLMGDEVPPRKRFIQAHAKTAELDF